MNRFLKGMLAAFMVTSLAACSANTSGESEDEGSAIPENPVLIKVNTEGVGNIAIAAEGKEIEWDPEFPATSIAQNVEKGSSLTLAAKAGEDYKFAKWTKNGEMYSQDETVTLTADEDAEYIAVFLMDSGWDTPAVTDIDDAKTLGDILSCPTYGYGYNDHIYANVIEINGIIYRVFADMTPELNEKMNSLDFEDEDYQKKQNEILAPLTITKVENLTEAMPSESELAVYAGKEMSELINEGFSCTGYNLEDNICYMERGVFSYLAYFEGEIKREVDDMNEAVKAVKVTKLECDSIADPVGDL